MRSLFGRETTRPIWRGRRQVPCLNRALARSERRWRVGRRGNRVGTANTFARLRPVKAIVTLGLPRLPPPRLAARHGLRHPRGHAPPQALSMVAHFPRCRLFLPGGVSYGDFFYGQPVLTPGVRRYGPLRQCGCLRRLGEQNPLYFLVRLARQRHFVGRRSPLSSLRAVLGFHPIGGVETLIELHSLLASFLRTSPVHVASADTLPSGPRLVGRNK